MKADRVVAAVIMAVVLVLAFGVGAAATPAPAHTPASGFFVAPNGSDSNNGTIDHPFATIARAQEAMETSSVKRTYIRAGRYNLSTDAGGGCYGTTGVDLTPADDNETLQYYPPDGIGSAILDGGSISSSTGLQTGICVNGASGVTINGLQVQHFQDALIGSFGTNTLIENNVVHNNTCPATSSDGCATSGIFLSCTAQNDVVTHNVVYDVPLMGIRLNTNGCSSAGGLDGDVVSHNFVSNACTVESDCGAIYDQDFLTPRSTNVRIVDNYVRDFDTPSSPMCCLAKGIYLDDGTSNVRVSGNVITGSAAPATTVPYTLEYCTFIHGGDNNTFKDNICDLGSGGVVAIMGVQTSADTVDEQNNTFKNNITVANGAQGQGYAVISSPVPSPPTPLIEDNDYFNYSGSHDTMACVYSATGVVQAWPPGARASRRTWTRATPLPSSRAIVGHIRWRRRAR